MSPTVTTKSPVFSSSYDTSVFLLKNYINSIIKSKTNKDFFECDRKVATNILIRYKENGITLMDIFKGLYRYTTFELTFAEYLYLLMHEDFGQRPICKNEGCNLTPLFRSSSRGYPKTCTVCYKQYIDDFKKKLNKKIDQENTEEEAEQDLFPSELSDDDVYDLEEMFSTKCKYTNIDDFVEKSFTKKDKIDTVRVRRKNLTRIKADSKYVTNNKEEKEKNKYSQIITCEQCNKTWTRYVNSNKNYIDHCVHCNPCTELSNRSTLEINFVNDIIRNLDPDVLVSDKIQIFPHELDFYSEKNKLAGEINGDRYHNEIRCGQTYHLDKTNSCEKLGISKIDLSSSLFGAPYGKPKDEYDGFHKIKRNIAYLFPNQSFYNNPNYNLNKFKESDFQFDFCTYNEVREFYNYNHLNNLPRKHEILEPGKPHLKCIVLRILPLSSDIFASIIFNSCDDHSTAYIYRYATQENCLTGNKSVLAIFLKYLSTKANYKKVFYYRDRGIDFLRHPCFKDGPKNYNFKVKSTFIAPTFRIKDYIKDVFVGYKYEDGKLITSDNHILTEEDFRIPPGKEYGLYGKIWNAGYEKMQLRT